jgi:hypothetical protein
VESEEILSQVSTLLYTIRASAHHVPVPAAGFGKGLKLAATATFAFLIKAMAVSETALSESKTTECSSAGF